MFIEVPKFNRNKVTLFVNRRTFKLRIYKGGYMVAVVTLWDIAHAPLLGISKVGKHHRVELGKAYKCSA